MTNTVKEAKVCLITGGNSGLGLASAIKLAKLGYRIFIGCRNQTKAKKAINYIRSVTSNQTVDYLPLDLASLDSVRTFVKLFQQKNLPLHLLINNAGVFNTKGKTKEGFEAIFGINYLGHFLLTYLLLENLKQSAPSQIINISSDLALKPTSIDWQSFINKTPVNFWKSYALSKLFLVIFTQQLTRELENDNVTVNAFHPGFVQSNITLGHKLSKYLGFGISAEQSAAALITCLNANENGVFWNYQQNHIELPPLAKDSEIAAKLWQKSCLWTGINLVGYRKLKNEEIESSEISSPYSLAMDLSKVNQAKNIILDQVLPKFPTANLLTQFLKLLIKGKLGSIFLLFVQAKKKQFYMERHLDSDVVKTICQDPNLLKKVKEYLGDEFVLWRSELWVNYPAQQLISFWHQDLYPNLLKGKGKTINVYIALTDVDANNGFEYLPNSHNQDDISVKITDPFSGNKLLKLTEEQEKQAIPVVLQQGEFILFTDQLIHRSVYNTSGKIRVSLTLRFAQPSLKIIPRYSPIESNF